MTRGDSDGGGTRLDARAAGFMDAVAAAWQRAALPESGEVCVTCSDEGRPGVVLDDGRVRTDAGAEPVDLTLVPDARPGDRVLVHAGLAIARLDGEEETA
jgi:hypothetical protein